MTLYFITGNKHKFAEIQAMLPQVQQLDIDLPEIQEVDAKKVITAKLHEAFKHHQGEFIVEDTSLYFDAFGNLPGPLIKRFLQELGNEGLANLALQNENTRATAKTLIGYAKNHSEIYFFEGICTGTIVQPRGTNDFGRSPILELDGFGKTFAEISKEEKNKISMRRKALNKLKMFLDEKSK